MLLSSSFIISLFISVFYIGGMDFLYFYHLFFIELLFFPLHEPYFIEFDRTEWKYPIIAPLYRYFYFTLWWTTTKYSSFYLITTEIIGSSQNIVPFLDHANRIITIFISSLPFNSNYTSFSFSSIIEELYDIIFGLL